MKGTKVTKADIAALAELKNKLSEEEGEITIPVSLAKDICAFCESESEAIYDKIADYGDFYYKLKMAIEKKELINTIKD